MPKTGHCTSAYIECPFFHFYKGSEIICEGVEPNSTIHLAFPSIEVRRNYMKSTCYFNNYKKCKIAQLLYSKYDK